MTIHTLDGCRFPLHEMNPEERFESHGIINVRVMRWQVHPPDDEQPIHLQRDGRQSTRGQRGELAAEAAANNSGGLSCSTAGAVEQLAAFPAPFPAIKPDHMHSVEWRGRGFLCKASCTTGK